MSLRIDWNNELERQAAEIKKLRAELADATEHRTALEAALADMSKAHAAGAIDVRIPLDRFVGLHRVMAQEINELIDSHIAVKMKIVDVVTRYSEGDFSVDMDRLPGLKAKITEAIDRAKVSFKAVADDKAAAAQFLAALEVMSKQHGLGWIDDSIPADQLHGAYAKAAELVNALVASHIAVKMKIVEVVGKYARGDFSVDMDRLPGKKALITEAIDRVKTSFVGISGEVVSLVSSAVRGDFSARGDASKFEHDFKAMIEGLNTLMATSDVGLGEVVRVLSALAKGDLTESIHGEYLGTFGQLKDDSNRTVDSLTQTISQIIEAVDAVSTSAREIAVGNSDLSQRTEEQASSLEETASSMEELTSTVKQNAENAKQANQLAIGASAIALKGGDVVGEVVTTMASITESSKKIEDIISVIDGIAFQTNILALNAAVEAARAGEQGRGFAVVAGEVRSLAQRSAGAAKEIKTLISDSVQRASAGSKLADHAGETMGEIVAAVKRVTDIMAEISAASIEQGAGIGQVNTAIAQMDQVTQQNAALVEEVAAAAGSLQDLAETLVASTRAFTLKERARGFAGAPAAAATRPAPGRAAASRKAPPARPSAAAPKAKARVAVAEDAGDDWQTF
jgi:methyl-accepting chemotaxis protein